MEEDERDPGVSTKILAAAFLVTTVVGVVLILLWVNVASDTDEPTDATTKSSVTRAEESPVESTEESPVESSAAPTVDPTLDPTATPSPVGSERLERCAKAAQVMHGALEAARPALDQWEVHVGAMNKLVVGAITLQQATDFWNRTRVGARRHIESYRAAWAELRRQGVDCPSPALMAPGTPALRPCARRVEAEIRVLQAARKSINTWDTHVQHMDMMRLGTLSPQDATAMWLSMWQSGVRDLDHYRSAVREAQLEEACPAPAS